MLNGSPSGLRSLVSEFRSIRIIGQFTRSQCHDVCVRVGNHELRRAGYASGVLAFQKLFSALDHAPEFRFFTLAAAMLRKAGPHPLQECRLPHLSLLL